MKQASEKSFRERALLMRSSKVAILYPWPGAPYKEAIVGIGADKNDAVTTLIAQWEKNGHPIDQLPLAQVYICNVVPDFERQVMRVINPENEREVATFRI